MISNAWTAASLVSTLLIKSREPLLTALLRVNLKDEGRHLAYSQELREPLAQAMEGGVPREMEDLVFESVRASVAALLAEPVWSELGLDQKRMRRHALERLERQGVLARYRTLVPQQLERCGFPVHRLKQRLGSQADRDSLTHLPFHGEGRLLEFGCGQGWYAHRIGRKQRLSGPGPGLGPFSNRHRRPFEDRPTGRDRTNLLRQ